MRGEGVSAPRLTQVVTREEGAVFRRISNTKTKKKRKQRRKKKNKKKKKKKKKKQKK